MPIISGADLTTVSTDRENFQAGEYLVTVKGSELKDARTLLIKNRIEEPAEYAGREHWEYVNLVQNDGKSNQIGLGLIKQYLEAVFGKGSAEAEASPPDTDPLHGEQVRLLLEINEYYDKDEKAKPEAERDPSKKRKNNKIKRVFPK